MINSFYEYWRQLKTSERRLILVAFWLIFSALMWLVAIAPAIKILKNAPSEQRAFDDKLVTMRAHSAEAVNLLRQPKLSTEESQKALQSSVTQRFGSTAQLTISGDRANLSIKGVSSQDLALWISQVRVNARASPYEAKLMRNGNFWDGVLVLDLPQK